MSDELYTATEVIEHMRREHNITMYRQTIWEVCRRHGIQPRPHGSNRRLGVTRDEIEHLAQSYRPRTPEARSMPQRAPHRPGKSITINGNGEHRARLAPRLPAVILQAERMQAEHYAAVVARMQRTGESAYEASTALRMGLP